MKEQFLSKAIELHKAGKLLEAKTAYLDIIAKSPNNSEALHLLGLIETDYDLKLASKYFIKSLKINPKNYIALSNYGNLLKKMGNFQEAIDKYETAIEICPNDSESFYNLALLYQNQKKYQLSEKYYLQAIKLNPNFISAINNLGLVYDEQKKHSTSIKYYLKGLSIVSDNLDLLLNLGKAYKNNNELKLAVKTYKKSLQINPNQIEVLNNLALVYQLQKKKNRAYACYKQAIVLNPNNGDTHWNYALCLLSNGDYEQGWQEYKFRWQANCFSCLKRNYKQPEWQGENLDNKTLFVHYEQGLGDTIQFVRFIEILKKEYKVYIIFETQKPLYELLKNCSFIDKLIQKDEEPPKFDYYIPLMSIPSLRSVQPYKPYIIPDEKKVQNMKKCFNHKGLNVGLCWAGNPNHDNDHNRSLDYKLLTSLFDKADINFYNLQKGSTAQLATQYFAQFANWNDYTDLFDNFAQTAAFISLLDIVLTVDTSIAHIAGAMGIKTYLLLPYYPDWRWLNDTSKTHWYSNMTILRQSEQNNWEDVIKKCLLN